MIQIEKIIYSRKNLSKTLINFINKKNKKKFNVWHYCHKNITNKVKIRHINRKKDN